jgi:hypothetical protein
MAETSVSIDETRERGQKKNDHRERNIQGLMYVCICILYIPRITVLHSFTMFSFRKKGSERRFNQARVTERRGMGPVEYGRASTEPKAE